MYLQQWIASAFQAFSRVLFQSWDMVNFSRVQWIWIFAGACLFSILYCFRGYGSRKNY